MVWPLLLSLFSVIAWGISESPQSFSFQGRLFNASGAAPLEEPVQIEFKILDPSGTCLLYQETQSIDLTNESGVFSLSVGSATGAPKRTVGMDPGLTMARVFKNDPTIETRAAHATCAAGYTPTAGDVRLLRVTVTPQSTGISETLTPDQVINSVPHAIVAETLQGLAPSDFIQKDPIYVTDSNVKKLFGSLVDGVVDASSLHHHDGRYMQSGGSSTLNLGSGGFNTSGKGSVGSSVNFTNTTFSVKSDSDANVGLAVRAGSGTQAADLFQVQNSAGTKLMGVNAVGGLTATKASITSTAGNQLEVKYDGTNYVTVDVGSTGTTTFTAAGTAPKFGFMNGNVGIGTTSPTYPLAVVNNQDANTGVQILNSSATANALAQYRVDVAGGIGISFAAVPASHTGALSGYAGYAAVEGNANTTGLSLASAHTSGIIDFRVGGRTLTDRKMVINSSGNVGIGTTAPTVPLEISKTVTATGTSPTTLKISGLLNTDSWTPGASVANIDAYNNDASTPPADGVRSRISTIVEGALGNSFGLGFSTSSSTLTEKMRITSTGAVGIGTSSPVSQVDVYGAAATISLGSSASRQLRLNGKDSAGTNPILDYFAAANNPFIIATTVNNNNIALMPHGTGNVGVGTNSPNAKLQVNGTITGKAAVSNASGVIDFGTGNQQYTTNDCGSFSFYNLKDGGSYAFAVQGTNSTLCDFTAYSDSGVTSITVHMPPGHGSTTTGTHTLYNIMVMGTHAYVSWIPGY